MGLVCLQFVTLLVAYGTRESASFNLGEPFVLQSWHLLVHLCCNKVMKSACMHRCLMCLKVMHACVCSVQGHHDLPHHSGALPVLSPCAQEQSAGLLPVS